MIEPGDGFRRSPFELRTVKRALKLNREQGSRHRKQASDASAGKLRCVPHRFPVEPSTPYRTVLCQSCCRYSEPLPDHLHYGCRVPPSPCSPRARRQQHSQPTTPSTLPRQHSERSTRRCVVNARTKGLYPGHPSWTTTPSGRASSCKYSPRSPKSPTRRNARSRA